MPPVRAGGDALRRLADADGVDDAEGLLRQVDQADRVGIAGAATDIGDHRPAPVGADRQPVGADAGGDLAVQLGDLVAFHLQHVQHVVAVAGHQGEAAVRGEFDMADLGADGADIDLAVRRHLAMGDAEDADRPLRPVGHHRQRAGAVDRHAGRRGAGGQRWRARRGGVVVRSITDMELPGRSLPGSAGSGRWLAVTRASFSSGVMAIEVGGPTTLAGTAISARSVGVPVERSITESVSGCGSRRVFTAPFSSTTLLSLAESRSWACGQPEEAAQGRARRRRRAAGVSWRAADPRVWRRVSGVGGGLSRPSVTPAARGAGRDLREVLDRSGRSCAGAGARRRVRR